MNIPQSGYGFRPAEPAPNIPASIELRLIAIAGLQQRYAQSEDACLALCISRNYRILSELEPAPEMRREYFKASLQWLDCCLNKRRHSNKIRNLYFAELLEHAAKSTTGV